MGSRGGVVRAQTAARCRCGRAQSVPAHGRSSVLCVGSGHIIYPGSGAGGGTASIGAASGNSGGGGGGGSSSSSEEIAARAGGVGGAAGSSDNTPACSTLGGNGFSGGDGDGDAGGGSCSGWCSRLTEHLPLLLLSPAYSLRGGCYIGGCTVRASSVHSRVLLPSCETAANAGVDRVVARCSEKIHPQSDPHRTG